ncbi:MAG: hypothetical protein HYU66_15890 [Armatimonadetes bacterium]|nr:hypothetical protein [Armatimonadota bacterium]
MAVLTVARAVLDDSDRAARELTDGGGRLAELVSAARDRIRQDHRAIDDLRQGAQPAGPIMPFFNPGTAAALESAERDTEVLLKRLDHARYGIAGSRARGLISSIDITMVDRGAPEREAAERIVERFMLAQPGALQQALATGLTFGEAAYVLGMAKAAGEELPELLQLTADSGRRDCVDRLSTRAPRKTGNVAILLKLIDCTLKDELDPGGNTLP